MDKSGSKVLIDFNAVHWILYGRTRTGEYFTQAMFFWIFESTEHIQKREKWSRGLS